MTNITASLASSRPESTKFTDYISSMTPTCEIRQ